MTPSAPRIARTPPPPASRNYVPQAAMGLLMEKELQYLEGELDNPARPFLVILGGAKVSDKIDVIKALMEKADTFLIGGAMAYTFFKAQGIPTGKSRVEADKVDLASELIELAHRRNIRFLLPVDNLETQEFSPKATPRPTRRRRRRDRGLGGDRYRARDDQALQGRDRRGEDHPLEWPARRLRDGALRPRHARDRRGGRRFAWRHDHRRRRFRHRGEAVRPRRTR